MKLAAVMAVTCHFRRASTTSSIFLMNLASNGCSQGTATCHSQALLLVALLTLVRDIALCPRRQVESGAQALVLLTLSIALS